ncbi:unnamed protein product [Amoebophrya sp. A25]|nr:unnamed protein product [Amoebophrya sp. A25]|eukprot:GSA25T00004551001.1
MPTSPTRSLSTMSAQVEKSPLRATDIERCPFLYSTASFSRTYGLGVSEDPGPGAYDSSLPSIGPQWRSDKPSAPKLSILPKHEKSWSKVFISREASKASGRARETPGPGTYDMPVEAIPETTGVRFSQAMRPDPDIPNPSPGPIYDVRMTADKNTAPPIGRADRWEVGAIDKSYLGPGEYKVPDSFAVQQRLAKSFSEGREAWEKVLFPGGEKQFLGRASQSLGKLRKFETSAKTAPFCRAGRNGFGGMWSGQMAGASIPGPGAYDVVNSKSGSLFRSKAAFNFGKPPPAARLNWQRQVYETSTWTRLAMSKNVRTNR